MTTRPSTIPTRLRQASLATLGTAAIALGTTTLGQAAVAQAKPGDCVSLGWYVQCSGGAPNTRPEPGVYDGSTKSNPEPQPKPSAGTAQ
jgi:hypothetical protein